MTAPPVSPCEKVANRGHATDYGKVQVQVQGDGVQNLTRPARVYRGILECGGVVGPSGELPASCARSAASSATASLEASPMTGNPRVPAGGSSTQSSAAASSSMAITLLMPFARSFSTSARPMLRPPPVTT